VYAGPISVLVRRIQDFLDRPLVDQTGLAGSFEWDTTFRVTNDVDAPTIFDAFEDDLGLKIEPRSGPVIVFVVDSVDLPDPD
jgi:uncharacterized protein (TIGR03435 family)